MIEYLQKLVKDGEYKKGLDYAEQLLLQRKPTLKRLLVINYAILICRFHLDEFHGASVSGEIAAKLAQDLQEWDYFGRVCNTLGVAYDRLRQPDVALYHWYLYLSRSDLYDQAREYEPLVRFNMGIVHLRAGQTEKAMQAYQRALEAALRLGDPRKIHGLRQALVGAYLQADQYEPIPELLAKSLHFIRHHPDAPDIARSRLSNFLLRIEFAVKTNRLHRARKVAVYSQKKAVGNAHFLFYSHMWLAKIARLEACHVEAISHSLAARYHAITWHRYDLELEAANFMYEITQLDPGAVNHAGIFKTGDLSPFESFSFLV